MFTSTDLSIYVVLDCSAHVSSASPEEISLKRKRENLNEIWESHNQVFYC